jgi:hypothetical protein
MPGKFEHRTVFINCHVGGWRYDMESDLAEFVPLAAKTGVFDWE